MKLLFQFAAICVLSIAAFGCTQETTGTKTQTTVTTPDGSATTTTEQKVETTPNSETKTTTEKTETSGTNPPAPAP